MVGDGSYLMMAQELVTAVSGGHQADRRPGAEPRLRLDRRAVGVARLAAVRHQLPLPRHRHRPARRRRAAGRPGRQRREPRREVLRADGIDGVPRRELRRGQAHADGPSWCTSRPTRWCRRRRQRAWWDVPVAEVSALDSTRQARKTLRGQQGRASVRYLSTAHERRARMRTIEHWIGGKPPPAASTRTQPGVEPGHRRAAGRGRCWPSTADVDAAVRGRGGGVRDLVAVVAEQAHEGAVRLPRAGRTPASTSSPRSISDEHGKVLSDARGEVQRGLEVVEFACGIPQLLKGEYSDQVSTGVDVFSLPPAAGRRAPGITPFNFPVMVPMWMHPVAIACGNTFVLKPSERDPSASHAASPSCGPRPACPTACSTSCTATRRRSTRCSTTRTSPRCRSSAPPRSRSTSTSGPPRTASGCRPSAARRTTRSSCPTPTSTSPPTTWSRPPSARPASAAWRSRPRSRSAAPATSWSTRSARRPARSRSAPAATPDSEMGPVVTAAARDRIVGLIGTGERAGRHARGRRPRAQVVPGHEDGFFVGPTVIDQVTTEMDVYTRGDLRPGAVGGARGHRRRGDRADQRQPVRQRHRHLHLQRRGGAPVPARGATSA